MFLVTAPVEARRLKSAFQRDDSTASFHHHARRHSPSLLLCFCLNKAWPTDPIGSNQKPRLHATIAILGSVSSVQLLFRVHLISWKKDYVKCVRCMTSYDPRFGQRRRCYNVSRASWKFLEEDVMEVTWKMLRRIKNVLEVTWGSCFDVSRASWKLFEEYVLDLEVIWRRCCDVSRDFGSYLPELLRRSKSVLEVYWKMLQRIKSVLKGTWRRCCNVAMLQRFWNTDKRWQKNVITPRPLETPPPKPTICESDKCPAPRPGPPTFCFAMFFPDGSPWKLATWRIITDDFSTFPRTVWSSRFLDGLAALITELSDAEVLRNRALMRIFFTAFLGGKKGETSNNVRMSYGLY